MKLSKRIRIFLSTQSSRVGTILGRRSSLSRHSSSVMDNFPHELISHIFRIAIQDAGSGDIQTLLAITGTCKQWRAIGVDDGQLWTRINLSFTGLARDVPRAVVFLVRSKTYPLIIHLDVRDPSWDFDEDNHRFSWQDMETIVRMLVVHAHKWRSFTLLADTWSPIFTFLWYSRHVTSMPFLDTLSLSRCNMFLAGAGQTFQPVALRLPINLFGGIRPNVLRRVSLVGVHIEWDSASLRDLEHLELKYIVRDVAPNIVQLRRIIDLSPSLSHLAIHGAIPRDLRHTTSISFDDQIQLAQLKSLSLGFLAPSDATRFLSLLKVPQINEIVLDDMSVVLTPDTVHDSTSLFQTLLDCRHFRFQDLQSLQLIGIHCDTQVLMEFLGELHSLSTLSLFNMPDSILQCLDIFAAETRPGREYICQALRELHCQDVDPEVLIAVVRSRAGHVGLQPLEKISLEFARAPAPDFFSTVYKQLADLGINVTQRMTRASQSSTAALSSFS